MDPLVKKVFLILVIPMIAIGLVIALPHIMPSTVEGLDPYVWFRTGTNSAIDLLWDPNASKFMEFQENASAYWVDDQAKMLWLMLEEPETYSTYIDAVISNLRSVWHDGYFPRRWIKLEPKIISNDSTNCNIENGLLRIMGDLSGQNASNPIRVRYYEPAGFSDILYLGGQMFMIDRTDHNYHLINYDILHLRAEQSQNPSFDVWNPDWSNETMLMPWATSYPSNWYYSHEPPLGCAYSTRFAQEKNAFSRYIGLERYLTGSAKNWRSSEFSVDNGTEYPFSFYYRGEYYSGGTFKVYIRWYDSGHTFISQNYTEFNLNQTSWQYYSGNFTAPDNAFFADVMFWAESDTDGNYYFDNVALGNCTILNANFETANLIPWSTTEYHSRAREIGRSIKLYNSYDYVQEWMPVSVNQSNFYNFTFFAKSAIPTTNIKWHVFYDDGSYSEITKGISKDTWDIYGVQASELSANKTIVAFGIKTGTSGIDTFIDDVAVNYKPVNATKDQLVQSQKDQMDLIQYVEAVQTYQDVDLNLTVRFRLSGNNTYISQSMEYKTFNSYPTNVQFLTALDGLSTITSGEGSQETAYSSVWIPGLGRRSHETGAYITTLVYPNETGLWNPDFPYFIVECKQIPEWAGSYGIIIEVPQNFPEHFLVMQTSNPDPASPYLHYLTYSFLYSVPPGGSQIFNPKIFCLNGYDFINPGIYQYYMLNLDSFADVDLSMNYHIGTITHALARYFEIKNSDPYGMALKTWDYYRNVFSSHNNGSYLLTTGKMMEASNILYAKLGEQKYIDFMKVLADYLVELQIKDGSVRNGTFPMKHSNLAYLDCHAACVDALKLVRGLNASYEDALNTGLKAIKYDYLPGGCQKIFNPADYGCMAPNIKRLFVYSNNTFIDDDFFTFKSGYVCLASLGYNQTLSMLGLSRVWRNVVWNGTDLIVYVCESIPGRVYFGTREDWISTNSETQPYGLVPWIAVARQQRADYGYYYAFLTDHLAIEQSDISYTLLDVNITGEPGGGTVSSFYLKGDPLVRYETAIPKSIQINGNNVSQTLSLEGVYGNNFNCYFYDPQNYSLYVKGIIPSNMIRLQIQWDHQPIEMWMPILPILGMVGFIFVSIAPVYTIQGIRNKKYADAMLVGFLLFIVGIGLIMAWLWG